MRPRRRQVAIPLLLAAGSYALAFAQRPGLATADTKINLHLDPGGYLSLVAHMWTQTGQLGDLQAAQQVGYLFPMGPFFALAHGVGLSPWVAQRVWLGTLLALSALGVVRLLDVLRPGPRGVAALSAGAVTVLNPFVVTYVNRTTVTLLAYAALPWLLLAVHRGLRDPRGWRWPAAAALLIAASGGGVNGAVTAWMLVGPLLLLAYELWLREVDGRAVRRFLWRTVLLTGLLSLWWVIPAWLQSKYGANFLQFTEQPGTVWGTTSAPEVLRLMSFWLSYVGVGFAGRAIPYFDDSPALLFSAPIVLGTLLLPAGALGGFLAARRWRYGPFFLLLALVGLLVMMAGFPDGTPLRHGLTFTYNRVAAVRVLRASYKAAPLVAIAYAMLGGVGAEAVWRRTLRIRRPALGRAVRLAAAAVIAAVLALAAWPLLTGRAQDRQVSFRGVPVAWRAAASQLDHELPAGARALVLPGELFSFYTWGGTVDPILPALSDRPVAIRTEVPYMDLHATDLLWTIDGLVHSERLLPGQLAPLAALIGVRSIIVPSDQDLARSDAPPPADVAATLASQPGFARPARSYGPGRSFMPAAPGPAVRLPEVRRYDLPNARSRVRVESGPPTVVDGSADALAGLAAFGALPASAPILYSADLSAPALRQTAASGGRIVISDTNRRRAFAASTLEQDTGPTLAAGEGVSADGLILDPFSRGQSAETVAEYGGGITQVHAPASPERAQFPEHAPFAAIDGEPATAWYADPTLDPSRRWLEIDFPAPRAIAVVELTPAPGTTAVTIGTRRYAVRPGVNRLLLGAPASSALRVSISGVAPGTPDAGGIAELTVPGLHPTESLRVPTDAATALSGADLGANELDVLLDRTTGDQPFRREPVSAADPFDVQTPQDPESAIVRTVAIPAARAFTASAWVSPSPSAPDPELDRLAGIRSTVTARSSDRLDGEPRWRASSALDGNPATAWVASVAGGRRPWIAWHTPGRRLLSTLRLVPAALPVDRPAEVQVSWPGAATGPLPVAADGTVALPAPVRARTVTVRVLAATGRHPGTVGIAEIAGAPRMPPARTTGQLTAPCGTARIVLAGRSVPLSIVGSRAAFAAGNPLRARSCAAAMALPAGSSVIRTLAGPLLIDTLLLRSPAPRLPAGGVPRSWLVLGESFNRGWQASCDGRELGSPMPIDGYANGWRLPSATCAHPRFSFGPQRPADAGYVLSAVAGLLCLILLLRRRRRRPPAAPPRTVSLPVADRPRRAAPVAALALGVAGALVAGFIAGPRAGALALPIVGLVWWRGIGTGALTVAAVLLLAIVVPVLYLVHPVSAVGGNHFSYAAAHGAANAAGTAAIGLLVLAVLRSLAAARRATVSSG